MATLKTLQRKKEELDKIINDLTSKTKILEERIVQVNTALKSVKTADKEYQKFILKLQQIQKEANESVEKFAQEKKKLSNIHVETQRFYSKFAPLVEKIENTETGFRARIKQVNTTYTSINSIFNNCKAQFDKIKSYADRYTKALKSLENLEKGIEKIYRKIETTDIKSNDLLTAIQEAKNKSDVFAKEISTLKESSATYEKEIGSLLEKAKEEYESIASVKIKSEEILQDIFDIYEMAADTGRSGEFDKRRKALTIELNKWERSVKWWTMVLFGIIVLLFIIQLNLSNWNLEELTMDLNFYSRFLLTSPIIFYLTFVSIQYGKAKKLVDIYSYKTTMAMSIKSHLELLTTNESLKKYDKEILEFTLEAFGKIYKEPYENEDLKMQLKMSGIELAFEKNKFKEFKEIITQTDKKPLKEIN